MCSGPAKTQFKMKVRFDINELAVAALSKYNFSYINKVIFELISIEVHFFYIFSNIFPKKKEFFFSLKTCEQFRQYTHKF